MDGDVALVAQGDEQVVVRGVRSTPEPELGGEAGLRGVEAPEGSQEPVARGPANHGVGVVQVSDVDADEVGESGDRGWGIPTPPSGISRRKWAEAERAQPAVARKTEAAIAFSTRMAP